MRYNPAMRLRAGSKQEPSKFSAAQNFGTRQGLQTKLGKSAMSLGLLIGVTLAFGSSQAVAGDAATLSFSYKRSQTQQNSAPAKNKTKDKPKNKSKPKKASSKKSKKSSPKRPSGPDSCQLPDTSSPSVHRSSDRSSAKDDPAHLLVGRSQLLQNRAFPDRRRRRALTPVPPSFTHTLHVGERFVYDVLFSGNPAGLAEAEVVGVEPYPATKAGAPVFHLRGRATASGVVSLLSTMVDTMDSYVDAESGASVRSTNLIDRSGLGSKVKRRETVTDFSGRGYLRIVDDKDGKKSRVRRNIPRNTLDPLAAMAWVRSLDLKKGERATLHVIDGKTLMRVNIIGRGPHTLDPMPSIGTGLGVGPGDLDLLEGTLVKVDRQGRIKKDARRSNFRAYITRDDRRLLLAIETDLWLGIIRLVLSRYDPPGSAH